MARIPRMVVKGEEIVYHIISKTALDGFVLGDIEKQYGVRSCLLTQRSR